MAAAGRVVVDTIALLGEHIRPGVTTGELDRLAADYIASQGGTSPFMGYRGYPASICTSPNAMVVHGIPGSLALGRADGRRWRTVQELELRNVSGRRLRLSLGVRVVREGAAAVVFDLKPARLSLAAGRTARVRLRARVISKLEGSAPAEGVLLVTPLAGREVRVPWTILFGRRTPPALAAVRLSVRAFAPSDAAPALLSFVAGSVPRTGAGPDVRPLSRLDLELWSPEGGRVGLLARLRDVLPGRYSFGVTGRDPTGAILPEGNYQLRLSAYGTDGGPATIRTIGITIK